MFHRSSAALIIGTLIAVSCSLTVVEIAVGSASKSQALFGLINRVISVAFAGELALRFYAAPRRRRFFSDYWPDLVSLVPAVVVGPAMGGLRLLRLFRLVRLMAFFRQHPVLLATVVRRGPRQLLVLGGLLLAMLFATTTAMLAFEGGDNPSLDSFKEAFWFSIYSLLANEPIPGPPHSLGGRIISLFLMLFGLATFAVFTGTISAVMVERMRQTGNTMSWDELEDHILICGWNRKAEIIVGEYVSAKPGVPIVVIAKLDGDPQFTDPNLRKEIQFLNEDFTKAAALELVGVKRASTCIILSDTTRGRNERDADARTVLTALTVEKLNPEVYTCAELNRREYSDHLALGNVNSFVVSGEHSAFLLAQAALNQAALGIFSELLSYSTGNRFCRVRAPASWKGKTFFDALVIVKEKHDAILIAVADGKGGMSVNPHNYVFVGGEEAVAITTKDIDVGA